MAIVGLIPFVYAAMKRKRRSAYRSYEGIANAAQRRGDARRSAYQSQSCHFAVRSPSRDDELGFPFHDFSAGLRPPPKADGLSRELFSTDRCERQATTGASRENARFDNGGYQSQSCRFAVRPSLADELVVLREDGVSCRPPGVQPEGLSRRLLLPSSRQDGLVTGAARGRERARSNGSAYQSQSCRFVVHHSAAYDEEYGAASTSLEDLSGRLLLPAGRSERGVSRSLRFSRRVLAWVSGA